MIHPLLTFSFDLFCLPQKKKKKKKIVGRYAYGSYELFTGQKMFSLPV